MNLSLQRNKWVSRFSRSWGLKSSANSITSISQRIIYLHHPANAEYFYLQNPANLEHSLQNPAGVEHSLRRTLPT